MDFQVLALTPKLGDTYLAFFDGGAFRDHSDWAGCYCHYYHCPKAIDWGALSARQNRRAMAARITTGEMEGYLALAGEQVVGWVNVQPRHRVPHAFLRLGIAATALEVPATQMAMYLCFVVHPDFRRQGVARALLGESLSNLRTRGFRFAEAYPFRDEDSSETDHYHGSRALFEEFGFALWRAEGKLDILRVALES